MGYGRVSRGSSCQGLETARMGRLKSHLVKDEAMMGTAYFPGGEEQTYRIPQDQLNLIGTAEVPITVYHADELLLENELPKYYVGLSSCYRREAGTYGKDTRGLFRIELLAACVGVAVRPNADRRHPRRILQHRTTAPGYPVPVHAWQASTRQTCLSRTAQSLHTFCD
jgi:hypothetical protein